MKHRKEKHSEQGTQAHGLPALTRYIRRVQGYYGSGGSYGYGGGFEHPDYPERQSAPDSRRVRREEDEAGWYRGSGPMEPSDAYGSFGSALGDHERRPQQRPMLSKGRFFGRTPQGYTRSDERIREDVCDQLMYGHVDPSAVSVTVSEGEVTLEGRVEQRRDKYAVEEIAASVLGVREVNNRLRVGPVEARPRSLERKSD
jgi:hypothetical protein